MKEVWDLDSIFSGGSASPTLAKELKAIEEGLERLPNLPLKEALIAEQKLGESLEQVSAFVICLLAQNVDDELAKVHDSTCRDLITHLSKLSIDLDDKLLKLNSLDELNMPEISFSLNERVRLCKKRLSKDKEALISDLATDGYHGFSELHSLIVGNLKFPMHDQSLSQGQIENLFASSNPQVRETAFKSYTDVYTKRADEIGSILNHIGGFRLKMYNARGWDDILDEPCEINRLKPATLTAMWSAVAANRAPFSAYLKKKAKLLGKDQLDWYDLEAPLSQTGSAISYQEGGAFIVKHFERFSPKMAQFASHALSDGWVEAEDRPGKRPGGFCINFPKSKQTRIFMTFSNTMTNVATLAHELGHAFHADCCFDLPYPYQQYGMNVAETASTLAEMIVADAAYETAKDPQEKRVMLDDKVSRSCAFLMNLHARFLFETRFYEKRREGYLLPSELSELMEGAQKEAYANSLKSYHPLFWASKLHFYSTDVPFYNFPYTFGYLFSLGIYLELKKDPKTFEKRLIALLRDTAQMSSEDLAQKHLGVRLEETSFWESAIAYCAKEALEFAQ